MTPDLNMLMTPDLNILMTPDLKITPRYTKDGWICLMDPSLYGYIANIMQANTIFVLPLL